MTVHCIIDIPGRCSYREVRIFTISWVVRCLQQQANLIGPNFSSMSIVSWTDVEHQILETNLTHANASWICEHLAHHTSLYAYVSIKHGRVHRLDHWWKIQSRVGSLLFSRHQISRHRSIGMTSSRSNLIMQKESIVRWTCVRPTNVLRCAEYARCISRMRFMIDVSASHHHDLKVGTCPWWLFSSMVIP